MTTKQIDAETFTRVDEGTYQDSRGGEWVAFEAEDMRSKIRWAEKELAKISREQLLTEDGAALYLETLGIQRETEEDLRIVEILFGGTTEV